MTNTPWFWDTPEGGGWVRYWRGELIAESGNGFDRQFDEWPHWSRFIPERDAIMEGYPGKREPTASEKRAWRKINPTAEGQIEDGGSTDD